MKLTGRLMLRVLLPMASGALLCAAVGCSFQSGEPPPYPARPIKVYVPFAAGGSSDTFARIIQRAIAEHDLVSQPLAIVNLDGAGGTIGSRRVKEARPDGYSILQLDEAIMIAQAMGRVQYGPESFEPIAATGRIGFVLTVSADSNYRSLRDLLARAKAEPETVAYAANLGAISHYAGLLLEQAHPGAKFRYVQYGGGEARFTAIKGGHIHVSLFSVEEYTRFRTIGLRAIAFFGVDRHPALPEVPSTYEQDVEVAVSNINYWWAPLGTPADRIEVLADALEAAMQAPELRERLAAIHSEPVFVRGEPLGKLIEERRQQFASVSPRDVTKLPNLPVLTLVLIGLVATVLIAGGWRSRRKGLVHPSTLRPAGGIRLRADLAIATLLITVAYVLAMAMTNVGYLIATVAFVLVLGHTLARPSRSTVLVIAAIALIMGPGLQIVLTQIFFVDLP